MLFNKRYDMLLYALSILICVASYIVFTQNIELSLFPHKTAMEYLFNFHFIFVEDVGYEQTNGLFIIARNCLGVKLFISLFMIMVFGFLHKYRGNKIINIIKFYFIALILSFVVTIIRISVSVPFCTWERFHLIHNIISLMIYFVTGLVLYFLMERKVKSL